MPITKAPSSSEKQTLPRTILTLGTWNSGKSMLSASASSKYPALPWQPFTPANPRPKDFPLVHLDDMFYHCWEPDCFAGFIDAGLAHPPHWDMSATTNAELDKTIDDVIEETTKRVKAGETKIVVVDTGSAFDTKNYARSIFAVKTGEDDDTKTKDTNSQVIFQQVLLRHKKYLTGLLTTGAELTIFNWHPKVQDAEFRGKKNDQKAMQLHAIQQKSRNLGDTAKMRADIIGKAYDDYMRVCPLQFYIDGKDEMQAVAGGKFVKIRKRWLTVSSEDVMARSKYASIAAESTLPADYRVVFDKIRNSGPVEEKK